MNRKFIEILKSFQSYLEKEKIEISKIKWLLKNAVKFPTIFKGSRESSPNAIDGLMDNSGLMEVIDAYCSFFNYDLLENIIHVLDFELGKELMGAYKAKFNDYVKKLSISDCPSNLGNQSSNVGTVTIQLDEGFRHCQLYYINVLKEDISKILNISAELLKIDRIFPGSVFVVFHLPISHWKESVNCSDEEMIDSFKKLTYDKNHVIAVQFTVSFGIHNSKKFNMFEMETTKSKEIKNQNIQHSSVKKSIGESSKSGQ